MSWVLTDAKSLEGTQYFEFLPGRYQAGSVFLTEEVFAHVEPIFERNRPDFDHYSFIEIPKSGWQPILKGLEDLRGFLALSPSESEVCSRVGFLSAEDKDKFLKELATNVEQFKQRSAS
jgi:hypothetical protein